MKSLTDLLSEILLTILNNDTLIVARYTLTSKIVCCAVRNSAVINYAADARWVCTEYARICTCTFLNVEVLYASLVDKSL